VLSINFYIVGGSFVTVLEALFLMIICEVAYRRAMTDNSFFLNCYLPAASFTM